MPTENEVKFVLTLNCEANIAKDSAEKWYIRQGYLFVAKGSSVRLREAKHGKEVAHTLTVKSTSPAGRCVEVEKRLGERDFRDMWTQTFNRLHKVRYCLPGGRREHWDVDFFRDDRDHTYFALAECEMPESRHRPLTIPPVVAKHLVFEVPAGDGRFASKLLADVRYAKELLEQL